jgi:putative peptide zinc metalloprotease protein
MASDMLCRIGDPHDLEAVLVVDQGDIEFVDDATRDGRQPEVSIRLDAFPGTTLVGRVVEVAKVDLKVTPANLSSRAGGELDTKMDASGVQRPMSTSFQALVPLGKQGKLEGLIRPGLRGRAKIYTRWQSLGKRVYRYVARTFHFEL